MNHEEAIELLERELTQLRAESYAALKDRISEGAIVVERAAPNGTKYQIEIQVVWDGAPGGNVRVMGSIDDGGRRAFAPLNRDFIKAPDGSFVGE